MIPVSIGLPVFNGENYLEAALDSILQQTFADFELIIRDNASTDATESICRAYAEKDNRIRYIRAERNQGAAHNYNQVFYLASGKYFRWASHDDLLAPDNIRQCHEYLETHPEVVLCYPATVLIDEEGGRVEDYDDEMDLMQADAVERLKKFWTRSAGRCNSVFGLIRSDVLRKTRLIGSYNGSDYILLAHLLLLGRIKEIPEPLFFRRDHELMSWRANTTHEAIASWFDPNNKGKVLPEVKRHIEYLKTIVTLEAELSTRFRALALWIRRTWWLRRYFFSELSGLIKKTTGKQG